MTLEGKVALITGAGSGIGRAIALRFAREGARVGVNDLRPDAAREVAKEIEASGGQAMDLVGDVSDSSEVRRIFTALLARFSTLDILVSNAGIASAPPEVLRRAEQAVLQQLRQGGSHEPLGATRSLGDVEWRKMLAVHLDGAFYTIREALSVMEPKRSGVILTMASIEGLRGNPVIPHYSAAKGGLIALTKSVAQEVGRLGIRVNAIAPGYIDTPMTASLGEVARRFITAQTPLGRSGSPEEIAALAVFLASDECPFLTGQVISPNGGLLT